MAKQDYSTGKVTVTLTKELIKKLDKLKSYPRWKGNRSAVIEAALEEFFKNG